MLLSTCCQRCTSVHRAYDLCCLHGFYLVIESWTGRPQPPRSPYPQHTHTHKWGLHISWGAYLERHLAAATVIYANPQQPLNLLLIMRNCTLNWPTLRSFEATQATPPLDTIYGHFLHNKGRQRDLTNGQNKQVFFFSCSFARNFIVDFFRSFNLQQRPGRLVIEFLQKFALCSRAALGGCTAPVDKWWTREPTRKASEKDLKVF